MTSTRSTRRCGACWTTRGPPADLARRAIAPAATWPTETDTVATLAALYAELAPTSVTAAPDTTATGPDAADPEPGRP
ncbi:hypothetical protein MRQ36_24400 [Micromonospora sp. R77]|uniref:hypothetical protein n=1 Tax=Micromonospora sp. R77 TaxID=2925836 RepID=UPI001F609509|nr:hypothetical protein [Micromonospora sp. R77]MCI4065531.1 hypothetical protein [Micromonospora sp. R77]